MKTLLKVFSIVGILAFCIKQSDAFGSDIKNEDLDCKINKKIVIATTKNSTLRLINNMSHEVMLLLFEEMSKVVNPRHLTFVCKNWYNILRQADIPEGKELHYSAMNPFMKKCMNIFWESRFYDGVLRYTHTDGGEDVSLPFKSGSFDLSVFGDIANDLFITTNLDHFFRIEAENESKTIILIVLRHEAEQRIKPEHPFAPLMAVWDADKAPVGIFWRWNDITNLTLFDSLTTACIKQISSRNIFENWLESCPGNYGAKLWNKNFIFVFEMK